MKIEDKVIAMINDNEYKYDELRDKWLDLFGRYENQTREGSITQQTETKVKLGQAFSIVEQSVSIALAKQPRFQILSRKNKDYSEVKAYQEFLSYQMDKNKSDKELDEIYRWAVITGLVGWKVGWQKKKVTDKGIEYTDPLYSNYKEKDTKDTESIWTLQAIKPFDLIWDTDAIDDDNAVMLGYRQTLTVKELETYGFDTSKVRQTIMSNESYWDDQMDEYSNSERQKIIDEENVSIYECDVTDTVDGVDVEKIVFVVGGDAMQSQKIVLDVQDNPFGFKTIGTFRPIKIPGKFYGYGLLEQVTGILDAEEDTFNMSLEGLWTDIARPMEYNPANIHNIEDLEYGPRKLVPVKVFGESVRVMDTPSPNIGGASWALNYLEKNKQNVTAITDYQTGADRISKDQTATEVKIKTMQSDQRSSKIHKALEHELLDPLGRRVLELNKKYLATNTKIEFVVGSKKGELERKTLKFKDIDSIEEVKIIKGSTTAVVQQEEYVKWLNFFQVGVQAMQVGVPVNLQEIMRSLIEEGLDVAAPEVYLPNLKELEKETVQDKTGQLDKAKQENRSPFTARVMPNDDHEVHLEIHRAALEAGGMGPERYTPEQMQALTSHVNDHVRISGGAVPPVQEGAEQGMAQGMAQAFSGQQQQGNQQSNQQTL